MTPELKAKAEAAARHIEAYCANANPSDPFESVTWFWCLNAASQVQEDMRLKELARLFSDGVTPIKIEDHKTHVEYVADALGHLEDDDVKEWVACVHSMLEDWTQ